MKILRASTPRGSDTDYNYADTMVRTTEKARQASTPRGSDADLDYANAVGRTTERHDRRRHREGQKQT